MDFMEVVVGDVVCDCRYKHLIVVETYPEYNDRGELVDVFLKLEDGSNCSATHCIDKVPHESEHPPGY